MIIDCLEQQLFPGDFVVLHAYGGLRFGVFVKHINGHYHIQDHYMYHSGDEHVSRLAAALDRYKKLFERAITGQPWSLGSVSWTSTSNRIMKLNPSVLPLELVELLTLTKDLLLMKRKLVL